MENEFKGTSGLWSFAKESDCDEGEIKNENGDVVCWFGDSEQYSNTSGYAPSNEDLSLILSAPEMLSLLLKIRKEIDDSDEWWMDSPGRGGFDTEEMDMVINKALGK